MNFNSSRDWWAFEAISKLVFTEDQDDADRTLTPGKGSALAHGLVWKSRLGQRSRRIQLELTEVDLPLSIGEIRFYSVFGACLPSGGNR
jgi:hypothetical protein